MITDQAIYDALDYKKYNKLKFRFHKDFDTLDSCGYDKHLEIMLAGARYRERLFMAPNRVGKTELGAFEVALHATGLYPSNWTGKRFDLSKPLLICVAGTTAQTTRDIIQQKLLGDPGSLGTGMIPAHNIVKVMSKVGVPDAVAIIEVTNSIGITNRIIFKSYDQRRKAFEGTSYDFVWLDEEPPQEIYTECLMRTATTNGCILLTYSPLDGWTKLTENWFPNSIKYVGECPSNSNRFAMMAGWDDALHLSAETKTQLIKSIPAWEYSGRVEGWPSSGAGAIYPVEDAQITVDDMPVPEHWPRMFAIDPGWNVTACLWFAQNPETKVVYVYAEYGGLKQLPHTNVKAIQDQGAWITGVVDPASEGTSQTDGKKIYEMYEELGLKADKADNTVRAGLNKTWGMLASGKLKIFKSCTGLLREKRGYYFDMHGKVIKGDDHWLDCLRYGVNDDFQHMRVNPSYKEKTAQHVPSHLVHSQSNSGFHNSDSWMSM